MEAVDEPVADVEHCDDQQEEVPVPKHEENLLVQEVEGKHAQVVHQLLRAGRAVQVKVAPTSIRTTDQYVLSLAHTQTHILGHFREHDVFRRCLFHA